VVLGDASNTFAHSSSPQKTFFGDAEVRGCVCVCVCVCVGVCGCVDVRGLSNQLTHLTTPYLYTENLE
jgi:hypothetical protein